ncbi:MAG: hypothetical protein NTV93_05105 [Verrucomicrobia bacterium]|nr:hypothetical protein [Verrucomicrobiota bacterium]
MNDDWDKDELWDLLGKAGPVSVSPFFARNVVREIRRNPARPLVPLFLLRWLGAAAFAVLTTGFFLNLDGPGTGSHLTRSAEFVETFDAAAGLDTLVAVEDVSIFNYTADL